MQWKMLASHCGPARLNDTVLQMRQVTSWTDTTARIVVIIDTHCLEETGAFIYEGSVPDSYEACCMEEVSSVQSGVTVSITSECPQIIQGCIPECVCRYLSDVKGTPVHTHRSIILNLACGASIRNTQSSHSLFNGWVRYADPTSGIH